jgi:hypothetical protein
VCVGYQPTQGQSGLQLPLAIQVGAKVVNMKLEGGVLWWVEVNWFATTIILQQEDVGSLSGFSLL